MKHEKKDPKAIVQSTMERLAALEAKLAALERTLAAQKAKLDSMSRRANQLDQLVSFNPLKIWQ